MRVLIIGNGGREAAIGKKLAKDSRVTEMFLQKEMQRQKNLVKIYL